MGREARPISYLSKLEVERIFSVIPEENVRDRLLFDLIYRYGLRRSEAARIRLDFIRDGRIWVARVKNGISSEYPLFPSTAAFLAAYLPLRENPESPFLFTSRQSGDRPISVSGIFQRFREYARAAGIPDDRRHVHVLRHSVATHLLTSGADVADVQDWLGHRDISSTLVYAKVTNKRREEMIEKALRSAEIAGVVSFPEKRQLGADEAAGGGAAGRNSLKRAGEVDRAKGVDFPNRQVDFGSATASALP